MYNRKKCIYYYLFQLEQSTTSVYRAPEMLDFFLNYVIGEKADIWALGCIYYFICYFCYPFDNGTKLAILNLKYDRMKPASEFVKSNINQLISKYNRNKQAVFLSSTQICALQHSHYRAGLNIFQTI
uniref:non-specific serine/threonine protein kinase n=1 Tax=Myxobolus squamalis TaxID=59785 RepID=A0A6B2FW08_MYXSQ